MAHHPFVVSRRHFLNHSTQAIAGLAAGTLLGQARAQAALSDRFELSIHQYSLKKLLDQAIRLTLWSADCLLR